MSGIGYKQIGMYLKGEIDMARAIELIKRDTRRYSKKQMSWFKKNPAPEQVQRGTSKKIKWIKNYQGAKKLIKAFFLKV